MVVTHTPPPYAPHLGTNKLASRTRVYTLCERWFVPPGGKYFIPFNSYTVPLRVAWAQPLPFRGTGI